MKNAGNTKGDAFPYQSAELLERGLAALGLPAQDDSFSQPGLPHGTEGVIHVRGVTSLIPLINAYIRELELFNAVFDLVGVDSGS